MSTASHFARASRPAIPFRPARRLRHCCESLEARRLLNAGDLDATFDGGLVQVTVPNDPFIISDVAVQSDGKVVLAGRRGLHGTVARLNADGTIDTSFGGGGFVVTIPRLRATGVAVQADGKIVVCGTGGNGETYATDIFGVARLMPDGSPDTAFGDGGTTFTGFGDYSSAEDLAIQRDGKIVVVGRGDGTGFFEDPDDDFAVARYYPNGTLDGNFNFDGKVGIGFGHNDETALAVAIDYNGNAQSNPYFGAVVVSGGGVDDDNSDFYVARLTPQGLMDTRFDNDGKLSTQFPGTVFACATGVVVQPGGRIVATGTVGAVDINTFGKHEFALVRYLPDGDLDPSFGAVGTGQVVTTYGADNRAFDVVVNHMGGLTMSGGRVIAFTRDGRLDNRFGGNGWAQVYFGPGTAIAVAPGRRLVTAGGRGEVARYFDVAPVVGFLSFDTTAHEAGRETAAFLVVRDEAASTPLRVYLSVGGTATAPAVVRNPDYTGFTPASVLSPQGGYVDIPAGETFATVVITPADDSVVEGDETAVFTFRTDDAYDFVRPSITLTIRDDDVPVTTRVAQVFVNGPRLTSGTTANAVAFRALAGIDSTYGYAVPAEADQLKSIPWLGGVNQVALRFDGDVSSALQQTDLVIRGVNSPAVAVTGFSYDPSTKTGVWTLAAAIVNDKVRLFLDDVLVAKLDGEWANGADSYPSGDGIAGGDFAFRINILGGDASGDGVINALDLSFIKQRLNLTATSPVTRLATYSPFADLNADGIINSLDVSAAKQRLNRRLPSGEPTATGILRGA